MYNENSFKNYIFWLKVKRVFFMIIFSIVGATLGIILSEYIVNVLLFATTFRIGIITVSTLLFFSISLLITANTGKEVQDGYWKIAVLRKLTVISKKLDNLENLDKPAISKVVKSIKEDLPEQTQDESNNDLTDSLVSKEMEELKEEIEKKPKKKSTKSKKVNETIE